MSVSISISRKDQKVIAGVPLHYLAHREGLESALHEIGSEVVKESKKLIINGPKTGRIYYYNGGKHKASAPGEPPANRTGKLARSGDYKVRNWQEMTVGETAEYADYLERGTRDKAGKVRIAPRPHLSKAAENKQRDMELAILEHVGLSIASMR